MSVFPFPGGPYKRIALGGSRTPVKSSGFIDGRITAFVMASLISHCPLISAKVTVEVPAGMILEAKASKMAFGTLEGTETAAGFTQGCLGTRGFKMGFGCPTPTGLVPGFGLATIVLDFGFMLEKKLS